MSALAVTVSLGRAFFQFIVASPCPCTLKTCRGQTMLEGSDLQAVSGFGGDAFRVPAETVCQWIHTREGGQLLGGFISWARSGAPSLVPSAPVLLFFGFLSRRRRDGQRVCCGRCAELPSRLI